ncbi:hypothetical protein KBC99_00615 [Candidatus Saccharibacteria bacterium]|nr:hypothetical protein [Candidatus Saccharibacteria bacterium]
MQIASIKAYQVLDSRGEPTIRVRMESATGAHARFDAPGSISVADGEAKERRDHDLAFDGNAVTGNIDAILNIIAPKFIGYPLGHQADFDALITALDGTADKSNLGTNTLTALSGAYYLLSCYEQKKEVWQSVSELIKTKPTMPRLFANLVSGGAHALGLDIQEIMIVPKTTDVMAATQMIYSVNHTARAIFQNLYGPSALLVADEGSMAPIGTSAETVMEAFEQLAGKYQQGYELAIDMAGYNLFQNGAYVMSGQSQTMQQLGDLYAQWDKKYPLLSIEDPFAEQDLEGLKYLTAKPGRKCMIVGDGTTATDAARITSLAQQKLLSAVVIKPSQVGTMTEMFNAIRASQSAGLKLIIAHRSGDTNDTFLSDLAYGAGAFGLKLGAPVRGERVAKYNRLLEIATDLGLSKLDASSMQIHPAAINSTPQLLVNQVSQPSAPTPATVQQTPNPTPNRTTPSVSFNTPPPSGSGNRPVSPVYTAPAASQPTDGKPVSPVFSPTAPAATPVDSSAEAKPTIYSPIQDTTPRV